MENQATDNQADGNQSAEDKAQTLLIVDDDKPFLQRIGRAMESRGFTVALAESVAEGLIISGLGFFIAKTLLERSGAKLIFSNRRLPAEGAVVRITWPRDQIDVISSKTVQS